MIITGIIIVAVALILTIINMLFLVVSESDTVKGVSLFVHIVLAIAYVVGLAVVAIGIVEALSK